MKVVQGNLLSMALAGDFDVIIHGCNCFCTMGKGISKSVKEQLPEAYAADLLTKKGDKSKMGFYSEANIVRGDIAFMVLNGYTQYDYWTRGVRVDYDAIEQVFAWVKKNFSGRRIGYPMIGAGLARGDWERISQSIDKALAGEDHTVVEFSP